MRLLTILMTFTILSCAGKKFEIPDRPDLDICITKIKETLELSYVRCPADKNILNAIKNSKDFIYKEDVIKIFEDALSNNNSKNPNVNVPLKFTNNWPTQSPDSFGRLITYLKQIEKRLKERYESAMQMAKESFR